MTPALVLRLRAETPVPVARPVDSDVNSDAGSDAGSDADLTRTAPLLPTPRLSQSRYTNGVRRIAIQDDPRLQALIEIWRSH